MVRAQYSAICFPLQAISRTRRRASVKQLPRGSRCRRAPSMRPRIQTPQTDFDFFGGESNKEELGIDYPRRLASSRRGIRGVQDALFPLALCTQAPARSTGAAEPPYGLPKFQFHAHQLLCHEMDPVSASVKALADATAPARGAHRRGRDARAGAAVAPRRRVVRETSRRPRAGSNAQTRPKSVCLFGAEKTKLK